MSSGLNHITLTCRNLDQSLTFYTQILGMTAHVRWRKGAYLSLGSLWFCLNLGHAQPASDYSHIAFHWDPADLTNLKHRLSNAGARFWQDNQSEGDSLYFEDPDGHKLEAHVGDLSSRLQALAKAPYQDLVWLTSPPPALE